MDWTFAQLATRQDETFLFGTEGGTEIPLVLTTVEPDGAGGGSLIFAGPADLPMAQGTYPVRHEGPNADGLLGEGLLFVVPIAQGDTTRSYQAVFG